MQISHKGGTEKPHFAGFEEVKTEECDGKATNRSESYSGQGIESKHSVKSWYYHHIVHAR